MHPLQVPKMRFPATGLIVTLKEKGHKSRYIIIGFIPFFLRGHNAKKKNKIWPLHAVPSNDLALV